MSDAEIFCLIESQNLSWRKQLSKIFNSFESNFFLEFLAIVSANQNEKYFKNSKLLS